MVRMLFSRVSRFLVTRGFVFALTLALAACAPDPSAAPSALTDAPGSGMPAARILYTADTQGILHPCRTCGAPIGGIARRAALLKRLAAASPRTLILAGPNEFFTDRPNAPEAEAVRIMPALAAAFRAMPYAAVYLSPATAAFMREHGIEPPPGGVTPDNAPAVKLFRAGSMTAACVFLPAGSEDDGAPDAEQLHAARQVAREAAAGADLVIAVSPWGMRAENTFSAFLAGYAHILLGGGPGIAVPGQASGGPDACGPLWARSDRHGRAVTVLDIFSLPPEGAPWIEGIHFSARLALLDSALSEDEGIRNAVRGLDGER